MYIRLQNQYKKLNSRIQKSIKNGHFYQFSIFKQQQLLARLKRFSLQMKQVAAGVAICTALGLATPAVGQIQAWNLVEKTGAANPLDNLSSKVMNRSIFVDIDNDGDQDLFLEKGDIPFPNNIIYYYENTGTINNPNFVAQTGTNHPLDGIGNGKYTTFVDIDNDGDMDCFRGSYYVNADCSYYKNEGTVSTPNFILQPDSLNPMDSVVHHLNALTPPNPSSTSFSPMLSFVDIDNDGDMDCFAAIYTYGGYITTKNTWYYENQGTANSPSFIRTSEANNPLDSVGVYLNDVYYKNKQSVVFKDIDIDGDMDAILSLNAGGYNITSFFENQGTATTPSFVLSSNTPVDSALTYLNQNETFALVDIDGDSDLDVFRTIGSFNSDTIAFFENLDTTITKISNLREEEAIAIYPNPTTGILHFEKGVTGMLRLFDISGQEIWTKEIFDEQAVDFSKIPNGLYFLTIENDKMRIRKKVLIQK
jgi:hypothetical protein